MDLKKKLTIKAIKAIKKKIREGRNKEHKKAKNFITNMEHSLKRLKDKKEELIASEVTRGIEQQLKENPILIIDVFNNLLKNIPDHKTIEVSANPADIITLKENLVTNNNINSKDILFKEMHELLRGSLIISANKSIIDAQISTQLQVSKSIVRKAIG